jgi:hypothetical protein
MDLVDIPPRRAGWRAGLAQYLARVAAVPFRPGVQDCALFAAGAVEAMTGADPAAPWRGGYRSLAAGKRALAKAGFADHVAFVAAHFEEIAPARAGVGDLALLPAGRGDRLAALGVVQGAGVYVLRPGGLAVVDRLEICRAWGVK